MGVAKYKYYFKKPKSEITKDIFKLLCVSGAIVIASSSPYFVRNILRSHKEFKKYPNKKISSTFDRLRRAGYVSTKRNNHQIYISLTKEGKKKAGFLQIDSLVLKRPKKWDKKWRLITFDIPEKRKIAREALRGKLKEMGFHLFQKSIWIYPFNCSAEIQLLKDFFGLLDSEAQLVIAEKIDNDKEWRKFFKL